jgi:hypothetical protein
MQKLFIGIIIVCLFAVSAGTASAAIPTKSLTRIAVKSKDYITKTAASWGNAIWNNKGSIAVGTAAVAVATNPAPFVQGTTTLITGKPTVVTNTADVANLSVASQSVTSSLWYYGFYIAVTLLCILGVRCAWNYTKDYKNLLPVLIVGVCFVTCGVAEAGVVESVVSVIPKPPVLPAVPWCTVFNIALIVVSIFF